MTVSIAPDKIKEIIIMLQEWEGRTRASKHQIQQILGKMHYVSRCSKPARLFVGRMLQTLRMAPDQGQITIGPSFAADVAWFRVFLPTYNGIHLIDPPRKLVQLQVAINQHLVIVHYQQNVYSIDLPTDDHVKTPQTMTLWAILAAAHIWGTHWHEANVTVSTSLARVEKIINTGASRHTAEMTIARNIWLASAQKMFHIKATMIKSVHIPKAVAHIPQCFVNVNIDPRL